MNSDYNSTIPWSGFLNSFNRYLKMKYDKWLAKIIQVRRVYQKYLIILINWNKSDVLENYKQLTILIAIHIIVSVLTRF